MGSSNKFLHRIAKQRALTESYKTDESGKAWPSIEAYIEKLKSKGIPLLDNVTVLVNVNGTVQEMTNKGQSDIYSFIQNIQKDGEDGQDGYSPTVSLSKSGKTTTVTITDKNGSHVATIDDGEDGYSPSASVEQTSSGVTISVTDKNGTTTATVKDGSDASITIDPTPTQNSNNAVSSGGVYQAIASIPAPPTEIFWAIYDTTTASEIQEALDAGKIVMCDKSGSIYRLEYTNTTLQRYEFYSSLAYSFRLLFCKFSDSVWGNSFYTAVISTQKIDSTSTTTPTDSDFYSALATKNLVDAVEAKIPTLSGMTQSADNATDAAFSNLAEHLDLSDPKLWEQKTWSGLTEFDGTNVWTDGTNIYYSYSSSQYVLNKATSTWSSKTWSGLTEFDGTNVWNDGTDIYYSNGSSQYVLNKATSTWSSKTWNGLTEFSGPNVWNDGTDIYYSAGDSQYVLNLAVLSDSEFAFRRSSSDAWQKIKTTDLTKRIRRDIPSVRLTFTYEDDTTVTYNLLTSNS